MLVPVGTPGGTPLRSETRRLLGPLRGPQEIQTPRSPRSKVPFCAQPSPLVVAQHPDGLHDDPGQQGVRKGLELLHVLARIPKLSCFASCHLHMCVCVHKNITCYKALNTKLPR